MPIYTNETDRNTVLHLGYGDINIATSQDLTEVIATPIDPPGPIGADTGLTGKSTVDLPPGIRIVIDDARSGMVLIDAISEVVQNLLSNKTDPRVSETYIVDAS